LPFCGDRADDRHTLNTRPGTLSAVTVSAPLVLADDDGTLLDASPAACELLGTALERLVGRRLDELGGSARNAEVADALAVMPGWQLMLLRVRRAGVLTPRERDALRLVAIGATTPQVAEQLGISAETVRTHVRNAMNKLGAHTRAQAIALAMRDGELSR
jgi:DNA-binding CsgD family transcriptional regulator